MSLACSSLTLTSGGGMNMEGSGSGKEKIGGSKSITVGMNFKVAAGAKVSFEGDSIALKAGDKVLAQGQSRSRSKPPPRSRLGLRRIDHRADPSAGSASSRRRSCRIQGPLVKIN